MTALRDLDRLLRGDATRPDALLREGLTLPVKPLLQINLGLAAVYGLCMGTYGIARPGDPQFLQIIATTLKVPALLALTLLVTFPSLYVFNTLLGTRLRMIDLFRLVICALGILTAVLASLGPIVAFFSVTTTSYPFILLLNVAVFAVSGGFGMVFLYRTLTHLTARARPVPPSRAEECEPAVDAPPPAPQPPRQGNNLVFYVWMIVFGLVGAQMGWVLRPFVGTPGMPFTWFRPREGSFFEGIVRSVTALLGG